MTTGWRVLVGSYRLRLCLAIVVVVAVALGLVLVSLPRLLEGFFLTRSRPTCDSRGRRGDARWPTSSSVVTGAGARPILLPDEPGMLAPTLALGSARGRQGPWS